MRGMSYTSTNHHRTIKYRKVSLIAIAGSLGSQLLMILRWANGIQGVEVYYCFPWAMGTGLLLSAQFLALTICSPEEQMASATAVYYLSQQVGLIVGTSVSTAALQQFFRIRLQFGLADIPVSHKDEVPLTFILSFFRDILTCTLLSRSFRRLSKTIVSSQSCHRPSRQQCRPAILRPIDLSQVCMASIIFITAKADMCSFCYDIDHDLWDYGLFLKGKRCEEVVDIYTYNL
jgi:hypothetical protein